MSERPPPFLETARSLFGFEAFRPGQEPALRALFEGHDVLAVLPTGSGKSAIYQIAASLIPGPTVVISPLIALQRDQSEKRQDPDAGGAAVIWVIDALGHPRVLALTATASLTVNMDRPNIWLGVRSARDAQDKRRLLVAELETADKPGLVYTATRRSAEEIGAELDELGMSVAVYHGGMNRADREQAQAAFMDGRVAVRVAISAFGMGIDEPDVRFVFHADVSPSRDAVAPGEAVDEHALRERTALSRAKPTRAVAELEAQGALSQSAPVPARLLRRGGGALWGAATTVSAACRRGRRRSGRSRSTAASCTRSSARAW